jgi:glycosyltransferase involved in cell wall biosynthesis
VKTKAPVTKLSVVVAAWNGPELLRICLQSLREAAPLGALQVIVAYPESRGFEKLLGDEFGEVQGVACADGSTVPVLRLAGLEASKGDVVAFLEDHASVAPGWADALCVAYELPSAEAVGGPIAQGAGHSSLDWGVYLVDYGRFMPPLPDGRVHDLSGLNMSFRRQLLGSVQSVLEDGVYEGPLFEELRRRGVDLSLASAACVYQNKQFSFRSAFILPYYLARGYAGRRIREASVVARVVRAASCLVLPAVMVWRIFSNVLPRRRDTYHVLRALGFVALISSMWSLGELVGYVAGPGDADSHWR